MSTTGNGATITFGGTGFSGLFIEIGGAEQTRGKVEDSDLSSTSMTFLPADLYDPGDFECEVIFASSVAANLNNWMSTGVETVTITYPVASGQANGATLIGSGFVSKRSHPTMRNNELLTARIGVTWDGKNGPTFANGS